MNKGDLSAYRSILPEVFKSVSNAVGVHVMLIVLERALWKTKCNYEEARLIRFSEEGINLDDLDALEPELARSITHDFIMAIVDTLGRLAGMKIAQKLVEQFEKEPTQKGDE